VVNAVLRLATALVTVVVAGTHGAYIQPVEVRESVLLVPRRVDPAEIAVRIVGLVRTAAPGDRGVLVVEVILSVVLGTLKPAGLRAVGEDRQVGDPARRSDIG
jgi:hypothetical protein